MKKNSLQFLRKAQDNEGESFNWISKANEDLPKILKTAMKQQDESLRKKLLDQGVPEEDHDDILAELKVQMEVEMVKMLKENLIKYYESNTKQEEMKKPSL